MAVITTNYFKNRRMGNSLISFLLDKWSLVGMSGMILNITSLLADANLPDFTGLSGLLIVLAAVFQKIREDFRTQKEHQLKMELMNKIVNNELESGDNKDLIMQFLGMENIK